MSKKQTYRNNFHNCEISIKNFAFFWLLFCNTSFSCSLVWIWILNLIIMKTSNVFVCAILIAFIFGCSPKINYVKLHESKELKMPFNKKDFEDTDNEFYSIQSTKGTGAKSAIAKMNTLKAKADLTFKLKSHISSVIIVRVKVVITVIFPIVLKVLPKVL